MVLNALHARLSARRELMKLSPTARAVREQGLTYLSPARLATIERACQLVNDDGVPGDFVEAGVALGGGAIVLATQMGPDRQLHGYDVFGMIPAPGEGDDRASHERYEVIAAGRSEGLGGATYYGYLPDLLDRVTATFADFGVPVGERVHLYAGLFEDTLHPPGRVALAHVDSDWYEPVRTCLQRIAPVVELGGIIVIDDYHDYTGCRRAVDEFLAADDQFRFDDTGPNVLIRRVA